MTDLQLRSLQPQTLLGERYRLEREIGRGGMAVVWLARDLKLNRDVAIKVLLGELAFAMGPERFRREIDVVSRLSHPYILAIDDFGEYEGHLYYVMQFISGETIHKRLERERQLPLPDATMCDGGFSSIPIPFVCARQHLNALLFNWLTWRRRRHPGRHCPKDLLADRTLFCDADRADLPKSKSHWNRPDRFGRKHVARIAVTKSS